ncbi:MAG: metalloregulator ArsR/SmtB family transcription factor [Patescibacteria group bacterium]
MSIANRNRLKILSFLKTRTATVSDIAEAINLKIKSTSKHLKILEAAGVIERKKKGLFVRYAIVKKQGPILQNLLRHL